MSSLYDSGEDYSRFILHGCREGFSLEGPLHEITLVENLVWEHRYRYYVLSASTITDAEYDWLERRLTRLYWTWRKGFPFNTASPLRCIGSSRNQDYPPHIQKYFASIKRLGI